MEAERKPTNTQANSWRIFGLVSFFGYPFKLIYNAYNAVRPLTEHEKELKLFDPPGDPMLNPEELKSKPKEEDKQTTSHKRCC